MNALFDFLEALFYVAMLLGGIGLIVGATDMKDGTFAIAGAMLIIAAVHFIGRKSGAPGDPRGGRDDG